MLFLFLLLALSLFQITRTIRMNRFSDIPDLKTKDQMVREYELVEKRRREIARERKSNVKQSEVRKLKVKNKKKKPPMARPIHQQTSNTPNFFQIVMPNKVFMIDCPESSDDFDDFDFSDYE